MNAVLSADQARRVLKGREPLVPIEYDDAIKALTACCTLDESKYWSDKADALAAWAKIYHNGDAIRKAKMLKLHAYRRMGELANDLRPNTGPKKGNSGAGRLPGAVALLQDHGLKKTEASAARRLALLPDKQFNKILENPAAPTTIAWKLWSASPLWQEFSHKAMSFRSFCRQHTPAEVAKLLSNDNYAATAAELMKELTEWCDEFEQRVKKANRT